MSAAVSYSITGASAATGVSVDIIRRAIRSGHLVAHYPTSRPVILATDLAEWIARAPMERTTA